MSHHLHVINEPFGRGLLRTWRPRADIPNVAGFELVVKLVTGEQAATKVVCNNRTGCFKLKRLAITRVLGWRPIEPGDRQILRKSGVVEL